MDSGAASLPPVYANYDQDPHKVGMQTENVHSKSTVVVIQQDTAPIRDHILWSIFSTVYLNACCLGFVALTYSVKSRDQKLFGDRNGAMLFGAKARKFNIAATVITITAIVIYIIIVIAASVSAAAT